MVILGLVLLVIAAAAIVSAVFTAEIHAGQVRLLGFLDMSPLTLFLVGLAAGLLIWIGLVLLRHGARRARARRKESKRLGRLADEVEQVERRRDADLDDEGRRTL